VPEITIVAGMRQNSTKFVGCFPRQSLSSGDQSHPDGGQTLQSKGNQLIYMKISERYGDDSWNGLVIGDSRHLPS